MYEVTNLNGINFVRIPKNQARKLFNQGSIIYGCTSNMRLDNIMCAYFSTENANTSDFDRLVNEFEYYNCNNECGYYTHFYVDILSI